MPMHHTLKAWQHAQRLAVECAKAANKFPDFEQGALADQLRRACYSIPLNIAEGTTRKGTRDYRRFLDTAWGLLAEVQSALAIAHDVGYLEPVEFGRLEALGNRNQQDIVRATTKDQPSIGSAQTPLTVRRGASVRLAFALPVHVVCLTCPSTMT